MPIKLQVKPQSKDGVRMSERMVESRTTAWFRKRGIKPTLAEYREVSACMRNGSNPLGIH